MVYNYFILIIYFLVNCKMLKYKQSVLHEICSNMYDDEAVIS